jgi:hypothetical protein
MNEDLDFKKIKFIKNEKNNLSKIGVLTNKIAKFENFINEDISFQLLKEYNLNKNKYDLKNKYIFGSKNNFYVDLKNKIKIIAEFVFEKELYSSASYFQVWQKGSYAPLHSDNSDLEGNPNGSKKLKYASVLYLNDDYQGGEIYFPNDNISIKPAKNSLYLFCGGIENIHGVKEIINGERITMAFWWDHK